MTRTASDGEKNVPVCRIPQSIRRMLVYFTWIPAAACGYYLCQALDVLVGIGTDTNGVLVGSTWQNVPVTKALELVGPAPFVGWFLGAAIMVTGSRFGTVAPVGALVVIAGLGALALASGIENADWRLVPMPYENQPIGTLRFLFSGSYSVASLLWIIVAWKGRSKEAK